MKFPKWSLFLFPIPTIVVTALFPILVIAVAVAVAIWAVIAGLKAAATKTQGRPALGENEVQAIAAPDGYRWQDPQTRVHDDDAA